MKGAMRSVHFCPTLHITSALAADNPKFDRARFLKAVGHDMEGW
mgnify:CR=1